MILNFVINTHTYPSRELLEAKITCDNSELKEITTWLKTSTPVKDYEIIYKHRSRNIMSKMKFDYHVLFFSKEKAVMFKLLFGGK